MDENYRNPNHYGFGLPGEEDARSEDVDSMDVHSRTEDSLISDLQFQEQLNQVVSPAPSSRKRTKKVKNVPQNQMFDMGPRSRARPRKPNEPSPFLSIDNLPVEKLVDDTASQTRRPASRPGSSKLGTRAPINTPTPPTRGSTTMTNLRSASSSSWNTTVPKRHRNLTSAIRRGDPPNHQVTSPFKHAIKNKSPQQAKVSPDQALKEQTAMATVAVAKTMAKQRTTQERLLAGKLLKAKLKPLNVVKVEGPSMERCRGIVAGTKATLAEADKEHTPRSVNFRQRAPVEQQKALNWDPWGLTQPAPPETRSYEASPSKTLQRRRQILNSISQDYMHERPQTMESLHRTSIASDLTEERERELKDMDSVQAEILNAEMEEMLPQEEREQTTPEVTAGEPYPASPAPVPASPAADGSEQSGRPPSASGSPEAAPEPSAESSTQPEADVAGAGRKGSASSAASGKSAPVRASPVGGEARDGEAQNGEVQGVDLPAEHRATPAREASAASTIRPEEFAMSLDQVEEQNRPRSEADQGQRKEVRFADAGDDAPELGRKSVSAMPRLESGEDKRQAKKDKGSSGNGTCQDEADQHKPKQDDDDDDVAGGGNPGRGASGNVKRGSGGRVGSGQGSRTGGDNGRQGSAGGGRGQQRRGGRGKQRSYYITNTGVASSLEDPFDVDEKRKPQIRRPKSQLGTWEDVRKPDGDTTGLSVEGVRQSWCERDVISGGDDDSGIGGMSTVSVTFNLGAPKPNGGKRLARPQSARVYTVVAQSDYVAMAEARMKAREGGEHGTRPKSARPASARPASGRKVTSAGSSRGKPASILSSRTSAGSRRVRSAGPARKQAKSGRKCSYCGKPGSDTINYHQGIYFSVCDRCSQQSAAAEEKLCNTETTEAETLDTVVQEHFSQPPSAAADKQLVLATQEIVDLETLSSGSGATVQTSPAPGADGGQILSNLDDLEERLNLVQAEIRECIEQASSATTSEQDSCVDSMRDELTPTPEEPPCRAEAAYSEALTDAPHPPAEGGFAYRMTVYQYSDEADGEEKPEEGKERGEGGEGGTGGNISAYDVTMMEEKSASAVKAEKEQEGAALLEMLCQQLGKSSLHSEKPKQKPTAETTPLEVVAASKPIVKAAAVDGKYQAAASMAPLCFRINARPPRGSLYYFAYGLDMNTDRFGNYIKRKTEERFWGLLYGFRLAFNKKGLDDSAGGLPNVLYDQGSSVEGCLYLITPAELEHLDKCMGYPQHFEHVMLPVWLLNCDEPDDLGVAQYCVPALMYIARDLWIHTGPDAIDNSYAVDQCLKAGDLLSTSYRAQMAGMAQFGSYKPPPDDSPPA